jgi:hypothetical protein
LDDNIVDAFRIRSRILSGPIVSFPALLALSYFQLTSVLPIGDAVSWAGYSEAKVSGPRRLTTTG